jgi:hypothetical protein
LVEVKGWMFGREDAVWRTEEVSGEKDGGDCLRGGWTWIEVKPKLAAVAVVRGSGRGGTGESIEIFEP